MIKSIHDWVVNFELSSLIAVYTFWIPFGVCSVVYAFRFVSMYKTDLKASSEKYYTPSLTVGYIVWHIVIPTLPAINIFAMVFDCSASVFRWLSKVLDFPLVRKQTKD